MWHDDSSPFRSKDMALRRMLEPSPSLPLPGSTVVRYATCHPDKLHWARGFCYHCYYKQWRSGSFKQNPDLQATGTL